MTKKELQKLIETLPKYPGILNHEKYIRSAVLIPLILCNDDYYLLFEVRKETIRQGGEICFPGGRIDGNETAQEAVLRETVEELGIMESEIQIVGRMDTVVAAFGATIEVFVGLLNVKRIEDFRPSSEEVERLFMLPVSYFVDSTPETYQIRVEVQPSFINEEGIEQFLLPSKDLGLPNRYHRPWGHQLFPVYVYKTEEGVLWGMTAEIVREFAGGVEVQRN